MIRWHPKIWNTNFDLKHPSSESVWVFRFSCHCVWERTNEWKKNENSIFDKSHKIHKRLSCPDLTDTRKLVTVIGIPFTLYVCVCRFYCSVCDKMHIGFKPAFFPLICLYKSLNSNFILLLIFRSNLLFKHFSVNFIRDTYCDICGIGVEHTIHTFGNYTRKQLLDYSFLSKLNIKINRSIVGVWLHILQSINVCFTFVKLINCVRV